MPRMYDRHQNDPVARSLDIVGDRWTLLLVRDIGRGHRKFGDLLESLDGISPSILSDRLQHLEREDIVTSSLYSEHPPRAEYALTEKGEAIRPVLEALLMWGNQWAPRRQSKAERATPLSGVEDDSDTTEPESDRAAQARRTSGRSISLGRDREP